MNIPETKFAMNGDLAVAYITIGDGPRDLPWIPNFVKPLKGVPDEWRLFAVASKP